LNLNFSNLSDRDIAEQLFTQYGKQLFYYSMKSWSLSEDEVWDILYRTIYSFINSYGSRIFSSGKQIEGLIWSIFKNKLRDKYRKKKRIEKHYQEVSYSEETLYGGAKLQVQHFFQNPSPTNPILLKLEAILDDFEDWERQLVICRANNIPYKEVEQMTGKKAEALKVYYQRLKIRISKELNERTKTDE